MKLQEFLNILDNSNKPKIEISIFKNDGECKSYEYIFFDTLNKKNIKELEIYKNMEIVRIGLKEQIKDNSIINITLSDEKVYYKDLCLIGI